MKKRVVTLAAVGLSAFALSGGAAAANDSGHSAIHCGELGNPGQAVLFFKAAGEDRIQTPPQLAARFGQESVGATIETFCTTPAG